MIAILITTILWLIAGEAVASESYDGFATTTIPADCDSVEFVATYEKAQEVVAVFRGPWVEGKATSDLGALPDSVGADEDRPRGFRTFKGDVLISAWLAKRPPGTVLDKVTYCGESASVRPVARWGEHGLEVGEARK